MPESMPKRESGRNLLAERGLLPELHWRPPGALALIFVRMAQLRAGEPGVIVKCAVAAENHLPAPGS